MRSFVNNEKIDPDSVTARPDVGVESARYANESRGRGRAISFDSPALKVSAYSRRAGANGDRWTRESPVVRHPGRSIDDGASVYATGSGPSGVHSERRGAFRLFRDNRNAPHVGSVT